jgi:hypothetical protein
VLNGPTVILVIFLVTAGAIASHLGWASGTSLLDGAMVLASLAGLVLVLKLPWDLYFEARGLIVDQDESRNLEIAVLEEERSFARRTARRLLLLCFALHLGAAALLAGTSYLSGGRLGYFFAVFFLVSTGFRPLAAFYSHLRRRLMEMRQRTRYPREDALELRRRVDDLEYRTKVQQEFFERLQEEEGNRLGRLESDLSGSREELRLLRDRMDEKVDRVCREFTSSIERLTEDRELLHGLRALVRLVKEA